MQLTPTAIPDVILIEPQVFGDERGFFVETYRDDRFAEVGISNHFVQDNHSGSRKGTLPLPYFTLTLTLYSMYYLHYNIPLFQKKCTLVGAK